MIEPDHDISEDCICGPAVEPVKRDDGSVGWVVIHHSLDGRELSEPTLTTGQAVRDAADMSPGGFMEVVEDWDSVSCTCGSHQIVHGTVPDSRCPAHGDAGVMAWTTCPTCGTQWRNAVGHQCGTADRDAGQVRLTSEERLSILTADAIGQDAMFAAVERILTVRLEHMTAEADRWLGTVMQNEDRLRRLRHRAEAAESALAARQSADTEPTLPIRLRVPTNRVLPVADSGLNRGTTHTDVEVVLDPDCEHLGEHRPGYGGDIIAVREWNEQVFLHELLHVALARSDWWNDPQRQVSDPNGHDVIARVEVALWETGWRWRAAQSADTEALGEEFATVPVWSERPRQVGDAGLVGDDTPIRFISGWQKVRRVVGEWTPVEDVTE